MPNAHTRPVSLLIALLALLLPLGALATPALAQGEVTVEAIPSRTTVAPGDQLIIAVVFDHAPGWHVWPAAHVELPKNIAEFAIRTSLSPAPVDWVDSIKGIQWPSAKPTAVPNPDGGDPVSAPTYGGKAVAFIPITVSDTATAGTHSIDIAASYQACNDVTCLIPESPTLTVTVTVAPDADAAPNEPDLFAAFDASKLTEAPPTGPPAADEPKSEPDEASPVAAPPTGPTNASPPAAAAPGSPSIFGLQLGDSILILLLGAILGGAILNLTPCVLPVIPIKVMTLVQHAGGSKGRALTLGLWMALGVVFFWFAAGVPMAIFSATLDPSRLIFGTWWVTLTLGILIAAMGLGIMGLFMINLPQSVYMINTKADSPSGSFMFGIMTAILGLPCFGFVAGGLLAGTAVLGPVKILAVFLGLGIGMAAPYLVLAAKPELLNKIPRTGPASELVKQVMGLLLLAAAAFFITAGIKSLLSEKPWLTGSIAWWAVAFFIILAAIWLTVRTLQIAKKTWPKVAMPALALAAIAGSVLFADSFATIAREDYQRLQAAAATDGGSNTIVPGVWLSYTPARFESAIASGKVVVTDFTADYCLICKSLRRGVLDQEPVRSRLTSGDVILIEVDLTSRTAPGYQLLYSIGRSNIPTLAIFGPGTKDPVIHNAYTSDTVLDAINQVTRPTAAASPNPPTPAPPTPAAPALGRSN